MLTAIIPKLPMRNRANTYNYYVEKLGFKYIGSDVFDHYLIVDYKTDTIDSKNTIDKKNEIYSNQLAIYSALLKKTFQTIRVRALFLFLNSPDIVEFEIQNLESIENEIIKSYI